MHLSTAQIVYLVIGPGAWVYVWLGVMLARARMNLLLQPLRDIPEPLPAATIVIPVKDEAARVHECIEAALEQEYPNCSVLCINDRSTDDTGRILDEYASRHPGRMQVRHIPNGELPTDWLGKCHALHLGTREVTTPWLLFVDSDVTVEPHALHDAMKLAIERGYDAMSIMTRLDGRSFWENLMIPLAAGAWGMMFAASATNNDRRKKCAVANGQFFLIRREAYESVRGHEGVKSQITEDVELMRALKDAEFTCRLMNGAHLASTRMHATLDELQHGWGRIFSGTARMKPTRIIVSMVWLIVCALSVYPMLAWAMWNGSMTYIALASAHWLLMTGYLLYLYRSARVNVLYAFLFPLGGIVLLNLLGHGVHRCVTRTIHWRGSTFKTT